MSNSNNSLEIKKRIFKRDLHETVHALTLSAITRNLVHLTNMREKRLRSIEANMLCEQAF